MSWEAQFYLLLVLPVSGQLQDDCSDTGTTQGQGNNSKMLPLQASLIYQSLSGEIGVIVIG